MGTDYYKRTRPWDDADLSDEDVVAAAPVVLLSFASPYGTHTVASDLRTGDTEDPSYDPEQWEGYAAVHASIAEEGIHTPLLVCVEHTKFLDGHYRLKAAVELGLEEVPVIDRCFEEPF